MANFVSERKKRCNLPWVKTAKKEKMSKKQFEKRAKKETFAFLKRRHRRQIAA